MSGKHTTRPWRRWPTGRLARYLPHLAIWAVGLGVLAFAWTYRLAEMQGERARTLQAAQRDLKNLTHVSQEHAERVFRSADMALKLVRNQFAEHNGHPDLKGLVDQEAIDADIVLQVAVIDAHGMLRQSSVPFSGRIDLSDRAHFKVHKESQEDLLYISKPLQGRASGKWSVQLSRRLSARDGSFAGVAVVSLDPFYFTRFFGELELGQQGTASLYDMQGDVLARRAAGQAVFTGNASTSQTFARIAQGQSSGLVQASGVLDGVPRIYFFRKLESFPLVVTIGLAQKDVFADLQLTEDHVLTQSLVGTALELALLLLLSWYLIDRQRNLDAQVKALDLLQNLTSRIPGAVFQFQQMADGTSRMPYASDGMQQLYGLDPGTLKRDTRGLAQLIHPDDREAMRQAIAQSARLMHPFSLEYRILGEDGTQRWLEVQAMPQAESHGSVLWHGYVHDMTGRKMAESEQRIASIAFEAQEGMFVTDASTVILRVNLAFSRITGYSAAEVLGQKPTLLSSGRHDAAFYRAMWQEIGQNHAWQGEVWNRRKNGEIYPEWLSITAVLDEAGAVTHYVSTLTDITTRKAAEEKIQNLAFYDPLTGLPNRRLLMDRLGQLMNSCTRHQRHGAIIFIDLDNFKTINDVHGHNIGDLVLQQVGRRLQGQVRAGDTVARLGGDEFVILLEELQEHASEAAIAAKAAGEKLLAALKLPFEVERTTHHTSASLGVALISASLGSVGELLKRADLALYEAKAAGRDTLRFFDPEMQQAVTARATLEARLREALHRQEFALYYQPQVDALGRLTGVEALVRWQDPQHGLVSPAAFIPLAEETGLILPLGNWVLHAACVQLQHWAADARTAQLTVSVNVSARQFLDDGFVDQVLATLEDTGAPATRLKLELTESLLVRDVEQVIAKMQILKSHRVGFSLDDFGTGYASLNYLRRLPLDQLKIDQSFLREANSNSKDAAIVRTIVALGQALGLNVIAEGVETQAQRDFLHAEGCHFYQGYLFGRPGPVGALAGFLS